MNAEGLASLLHRCSKIRAYRRGMSLHGLAITSGMHSDTIISNHVLNMYAKCGDISLARRVFDGMPERSLVSYSAMISGCSQAGDHGMALGLFSQMGVAPNEYVYASAISSCASLEALLQGQQIHAHSLKSGYAAVSFVANSLISLYMKLGRCDDAESVYDCVAEPNTVTYNTLIAGFVENHQTGKGFEVFKVMHQQGLLPDRFTFVVLAGIPLESKNLQKGMAYHCLAIKLRLDSCAFVGNLIMTMYSKFILFNSVERAFRVIKDKDSISWNALMTASNQCLDYTKSMRIFKQLKVECTVLPDDFSYTSVIAACAELASLHHGKQIHAHLIRTKLSWDVGVGNALVNLYAKCGSLEYACRVFWRMLSRNLVSWNTMIAVYGNHGLGERAIEIFEQMLAMGVRPDSITFVGLLIACNHAGLVDKGLAYFNIMIEQCGVSPDLEHFSCLIDMLGRAGRLYEAEELISEYDFGHDPVISGSLLSACRLHGNVDIAERLAKRLLKLQPLSTSPYVLLSNLYASGRAWGDVAEARKLLKVSGLKKEPGHSLIEANGTLRKFTMGNFSHAQEDEVKDLLRNLDWAVGDIDSCQTNIFVS
ncbi:pentatricopeptide repeat-containing protein At4g33170-like [Syzygium oleosum]|uniref:pentatricopeptide repeat-containing protein At4g33170-like n=1 Tax=Syzygium oleosum TaxID=219896 RepID=UPI0011D24FDB|nr:pentatricopeptide repeat-containing protein At4g33170-like [Syzygium oleosum]XP_056160720.1 pentatricopeptide repeat-containing protein At4g33170-like [Syzygium oleosum]XP_056160726.1 pentatricopeptide repeat-containing protein At4g33170-like [Syzygium oleosum]XP_056160731.1 pentatricopeptide repeat-containing protein At4g33170-like [Syzygium oleosum]XP_056160736.1 pentatricopeptide repeat-containing protein At4g33170-like [Syzygium oleosum]